MGILKEKPILFSKDFKHSDDPFYADNLKYKSVSQESIPNDSKDVLVKRSQAVFFTIDNILQKLLDNDRYISQLIEKIENNSIPKERAAEAFKQDIDELSSSTFENTYKDHINVYHNKKYTCPDGSKFEQLEDVYKNRMHRDFSNFDADAARGTNDVPGTFLHRQDLGGSLSSFLQDVVVNIEYDDMTSYPTNNLAVYVCNDLTDLMFSTTMSKRVATPVTNLIQPTTKTTYIYREWLSGLKEFFIYIPSTFTFYTENLGDYGTIESTGEYKHLDPHTRCTWIRVVINKRHFKLEHIYLMEICPLSLPLQIHADKHSYFNDCPLPSLVRTLCMSRSKDNNTNCIYDEETDMLTMYFCCYGTDAQAIRILAD